MWKHSSFSRGCVGLVLLSVTLSLVGCHGQRSPAATAPAADARAADVVPVQQSPPYRAAVRLFAGHQYPAALVQINSLLRQPQYQNRPADRDFLRQQQTICRRAIDPHALAPHLASTSVPASPTAPRPAAQADCGPRALLLLCPHLGVRTTLDTLRTQAGTTAAGTSLAGLARAAQAVGLKAKGVRVDKPALEQLAAPAVVWVDGNHYVALLSVAGQRATIHDPNQQAEEVLPVTQLLQRSGGILLTLSR